MRHFRARSILAALACAISGGANAAVDSYRFTHVTISTPWYIFIFLMLGVFAPFVLMVVLAWRNALRKSASESAEHKNEPTAE